MWGSRRIVFCLWPVLTVSQLPVSYLLPLGVHCLHLRLQQAPGYIPMVGAGSFNQHLAPCFTNSPLPPPISKLSTPHSARSLLRLLSHRCKNSDIFPFSGHQRGGGGGEVRRENRTTEIDYKIMGRYYKDEQEFPPWLLFWPDSWVRVNALINWYISI